MKDTRPVMFGVGFVLIFTLMNIFYTIRDEDATAQGRFCEYDANDSNRHLHPVPSGLLLNRISS